MGLSMAKLYGVLIAGRGPGFARRSLTSNDFVQADVALKRAGGANVTLRLLVVDGVASLLQYDGRWAEAMRAPATAWRTLVHVADKEISGEAS